MQAFQKNVLEMYVRRAMQTGTMADAAIAADYLCKVSGSSYANCMAALCKAYGIRHAERVCKDRPGMYVSKDPARELAAGCIVKFDKETISVKRIPEVVPAAILMAI
jgi:hypothetical protein